MPYFVKKPIEVEARRVPVWSQYGKNPGEIEAYVNESIKLAAWCEGISHMMLADDEQVQGSPGIGPHIVIPTLEGDMIASPGDWIIKGVSDEFYLCKPDIFYKTYEEVT